MVCKKYTQSNNKFNSFWIRTTATTMTTTMITTTTNSFFGHDNTASSLLHTIGIVPFFRTFRVIFLMSIVWLKTDSLPRLCHWEWIPTDPVVALLHLHNCSQSVQPCHFALGWPTVPECPGLSRNRGCVSHVPGRCNPGQLSVPE